MGEEEEAWVGDNEEQTGTGAQETQICPLKDLCLLPTLPETR
jgi:hypothetical protein